MNYKPFSELEVGAIFCDVEHRKLYLMKLDYANKAVLLQSVWLNDKLMPRGTMVEYEKKECIIVSDEEDFLLTAKRNDPIDPRRRFWKPGATTPVGWGRSAQIEIFAGLFLYSGFGMGTYYAATDNEEIWCGQTEAEKRAAAEGVLCVHYDHKNWTSDPTLKFEKDQALERRNNRSARAAEQGQCS